MQKKWQSIFNDGNHQHQPMVMVSVTNKDILMGQMLYYFKKLSDRLATAHIEKMS